LIGIAYLERRQTIGQFRSQSKDPTPSSEPKSGRRNIFKEDEKQITAAAKKYNWEL
jgi:hypothetical protein